MLDVDIGVQGDDDTEESKLASVLELCEQCAKVMKQQQLNPSSFLARFFDKSVLSQHAEEVLQKSGKGSPPTLAERIAGEWAKGKPFPKPQGPDVKPGKTNRAISSNDNNSSPNQKRIAMETGKGGGDTDAPKVPRKKMKT